MNKTNKTQRLNLTKSLTLLSLALSSPCYAMVNTQLGSWEWTSKVLELELKYHSQSLYQGWFGQGWCSPFDIEIEVSTGSPQLKKCGKTEGQEKLNTLDEGFLYKHQGQEYHFNTLGKITHLKALNNSFSPISFTWEGGAPRSVEIGGEIWKVNTDDSGKWISQLSSHRHNYEFKYTKDQVAQILKNSKDGQLLEILTSFSYDLQSNMNFIDTPLRKVRLFYDKQSDRILEVQLNNGCRTTYIYSESHMQNEFALSTTIKKQCLDEILGERQIFSEFDLSLGSLAQLKNIQEVAL